MRTHWELYDKAAAVAVIALDEDTATVGLDDVLDDREPESGRAGRITIGTVLGEAFEDVIANFRRDAGPAIRHFELREITTRRPGRDLDGSTLGRVAQRVADEVGNHP